MPEDRDTLEAIAGQVTAALDSAELAAFVPTVRGARIVDIRGFEDRESAAQQAGLPR